MLKMLEQVSRDLDERGMTKFMPIHCPHELPKRPPQQEINYLGHRLDFCGDCRKRILCESSRMRKRNKGAFDMDTRTGELVDVSVLNAMPPEEREHYRLIKPTTLQRLNKKVQRNDPCPCNSGKKFKACCLRRRVKV